MSKFVKISKSVLFTKTTYSCNLYGIVKLSQDVGSLGVNSVCLAQDEIHLRAVVSR
jgi:hypothetical protein